MVYSRRQKAQGLVEFGLILALVAVIAIGGLLIFGGVVSGMIQTLGQTVALNV